MKIAELIAELQKYPPDALVLVDGYEGGFCDPAIRADFARLDANNDKYEGPHCEAQEKTPGAVPVVVVGR